MKKKEIIKELKVIATDFTYGHYRNRFGIQAARECRYKLENFIKRLEKGDE